jgi:hypothetical protein
VAGRKLLSFTKIQKMCGKYQPNRRLLAIYLATFVWSAAPFWSISYKSVFQKILVELVNFKNQNGAATEMHIEH